MARKAPPGEPLWEAARSKLVCKHVMKPFVLTKIKVETLPCSDANQRGPEDGRIKGRDGVHGTMPSSMCFLARFSGTEK